MPPGTLAALGRLAWASAGKNISSRLRRKQMRRDRAVNISIISVLKMGGKVLFWKMRVHNIPHRGAAVEMEDVISSVRGKCFVG